MKQIINSKESYCHSCGAGSAAKLENSLVICFNCGSDDLLDPYGKPFKPLFGYLKKSLFQASPY